MVIRRDEREGARGEVGEIESENMRVVMCMMVVLVLFISKY